MTGANDLTGEVNIRIAKADDCAGIKCGERLESALSLDDYARWLDSHDGRPPMAPHSHLIANGKTPDTRETIFAIPKVAHAFGSARDLSSKFLPTFAPRPASKQVRMFKS